MNMKKIAFVLAALVALACNKSETPDPEDSLTINGSKNLSFEIAGGKQNIVFTTNADWTARPSSTWLDLSVEKGAKGAGSVELTVTQNTGYTVRNGYIAFAAGTAKDTVYVTQACADFLNVEPSSFSVGNAGGVYFSKLKTTWAWRRTVTMHFEDKTEEVCRWAQTMDRRTFNEQLEAWYNER